LREWTLLLCFSFVVGVREARRHHLVLLRARDQNKEVSPVEI
jgi:hypothetical protein